MNMDMDNDCCIVIVKRCNMNRRQHSMIVLKYCDGDYELFNLREETNNTPHNGRNIGNYEDYRCACVYSQCYYVKKINQEQYETLFNVSSNENKICILNIYSYPTIVDMLDEVTKIQQNYSNHLFTHEYECVKYEDVNDHDFYIMYIHIEM